MRFAIVGGVCFITGLAIQWGMTSSAGLHYLIGYAAAVVATSLLNWILNRRWTFSSDDPHRLKQVMRHQVVNLFGLCLSTALYIALVSGLGWHYLLAHVSIAVLMLTVSFILQRYLVFGRLG